MTSIDTELYPVTEIEVSVANKIKQRYTITSHGDKGYSYVLIDRSQNPPRIIENDVICNFGEDLMDVLKEVINSQWSLDK